MLGKIGVLVESTFFIISSFRQKIQRLRTSIDIKVATGYVIQKNKIVENGFRVKKCSSLGRNLSEYMNMFNLSEFDLDKRIISFGDGPASFNFEMDSLGKKCISIDPIYQFTSQDLKERFNEVRIEVMEQINLNKDNFVWDIIKTPEELENIRVKSITDFLTDFEKGKIENRYLCHSLPEKLDFEDKTFELGFSSHFLILYSNLGLEFHIKAITEMLRLCEEIRIFPILNLNAENSIILQDIIAFFEPKYELKLGRVNYEFQKGGNKMLVIKPK